MKDDTEINAMTQISRMLSELDPSAAARVIRWAVDRYRGDTPNAAAGLTVSLSSERPAAAVVDPGTFQDFAALYHAAGPSTDPERTLVAGYWLQCVKNERDFGSQMANAALKELGYRVGSVNKAFDNLIQRRPSLAMQVGKGGSTQQARKRYRLTEAGVRRVLEMIAGTELGPQGEQ